MLLSVSAETETWRIHVFPATVSYNSVCGYSGFREVTVTKTETETPFFNLCKSYMIFQLFFSGLFDWIAFNWVWFERSRPPSTSYISKLSVRVKICWHGSGSASVVVAEAPWTLPFDVRVLKWIKWRFVLLFWVLYVTSQPNFQTFVSRPFTNITSEINALSVRILI